MTKKNTHRTESQEKNSFGHWEIEEVAPFFFINIYILFFIRV